MEKITIDTGKITISPFEFYSILEIRIDSELNKHSTLYARGIIEEKQQFKPVNTANEIVKIVCKNGEQVYFKGVLQNVKITRVSGVYYLEINAASSTVLLDIVKQKRSFQDNSQKYEKIVETVISDKNGNVSYNAPAKTVENIILQYNETDWEFSKRLASHTNDVLIPIIDDNPFFHFGVPSSRGAILKSTNYSLSKDMEAYRSMDAEPKTLTVDKVNIYTVETDAFVCELGEKVELNDIKSDLYACHISISLVDCALTVTYTLCEKKSLSTPKAFNSAITGLTLNGKVMNAENDNVKLHLDIDKKQDKDKAHLFVYSTGYSTEQHTGWYVMPEEGDTVQLLFPVEDEKYAYAVSSIRQTDTGKTSDPLVKYWRTTFGKEIKMDKKEILVSAQDDETYIRINMDKGINIKSPDPIRIVSEDNLDIGGMKNISIVADSNILASANSTLKLICNRSSYIVDGDINMIGKTIEENCGM
jgi:hypothetical protein